MRARPPYAALLTVLSLCIAAPFAALAQERGPQMVVGDFCQADGWGRRVSVAGWRTIAPLVSWPLEPAWDHVVLITGYQVGAPRLDGDAEAVDVHYGAAGEITAYGFNPAAFTETVTYRLHPFAGVTWRLDGPPPPPHLFASNVDVARMRQSLARGGLNFITDSVFAWQSLHAAGFDVDFERIADLLSAPAYRPTGTPRPGDLLVYLRDGTPYHVGVLEPADRVVSSTLNAGIVAAAPGAFPGEVRYLRPAQPAAVAVPIRAAAVEHGTGGRAVTVRPPHTPTPAARRRRRTPARHTTPPAARHRAGTSERRPVTRRARPRGHHPAATPTPQ